MNTPSKFLCLECPTEFQGYLDLQLHVVSKHRDHCFVCRATFQNEKAVLKHLQASGHQQFSLRQHYPDAYLNLRTIGNQPAGSTLAQSIFPPELRGKKKQKREPSAKKGNSKLDVKTLKVVKFLCFLKRKC
jgi:hypothetical protein